MARHLLRRHRQQRLHLLAGVQLQQVHDGGAPGGAPGLGNLVAVQLVHPAPVGEEHQHVVGVHHVHLLDEVLLPGGGPDDALAAPLLGAVGGLGQALHVAVVGQRDHHVLLLDQVEHVDLALQRGDLGAALVGVLALDLQYLVLDDAQHHALVRQDLLVIGDQLL